MPLNLTYQEGMIQPHRRLLSPTNHSIPTYYKLQGGLFLTAALVTFVSAMFASSPVGSSLFSTIIFKLSVFLLVMAQFSVLTGVPILWLNMIEAAPMAMFQFRRAWLFVFFFLRLVARLRGAKIRSYARFQRQRPFQSGYYSLANLFAVTAVPYRLYPLSCTLLE